MGRPWTSVAGWMTQMMTTKEPGGCRMVERCIGGRYESQQVESRVWGRCLSGV
eukprot:NODE_8764_length_240_cov_531.057592_g7604_i0.p2 GENE.NODE_8764_length_240_cov_531.057592_g7604_i0~~NODE_8764_length_240_cov_531.057592_g7604_i0.p2  ORF type:complete len:63 (+),score=33.04 NODE_8764_length_240_cov_531.057592_g7604_i0:32-190(+)